MTIILGVLGVLVLLVVVFMATKKVAPISWGLWGPVNASGGVAIAGYDPVTYHSDSGPQKGSADKTFRWKDVDWHFVSDENKALFEASPERYAPAFGGFCAFAVSKGVTAGAKPDIWHLHDDKVYLFADEGPKNDWVGALGDGIAEKGAQNWGDR